MMTTDTNIPKESTPETHTRLTKINDTKHAHNAWIIISYTLYTMYCNHWTDRPTVSYPCTRPGQILRLPALCFPFCVRLIEKRTPPYIQRQMREDFSGGNVYGEGGEYTQWQAENQVAVWLDTSNARLTFGFCVYLLCFDNLCAVWANEQPKHRVRVVVKCLWSFCRTCGLYYMRVVWYDHKAYGFSATIATYICGDLTVALARTYNATNGWFE